MDVANEVLVTLRQIARALDLYSQSLVKRIGLTGPQLIIIKELALNESLTPGMLAKYMSISQATITSMIDRLEAKGFVKRQRDKFDRRKVKIILLDPGKEILKSNPSLLMEEFINKFEELQPWEQTLILSSLQRVSDLMQAEQFPANPILSDSEFNKVTKSINKKKKAKKEEERKEIERNEGKKS
ncbi:MAG: MarR family transcriptional regulator [Spirochaetia bacterium]|nr:MarR family transcriptional regulator [Spirochaetia bacterium]